MTKESVDAAHPKMGRIPELDLLRFVAAAASVVIYHYTYRPEISGTIDENVFWLLQEISRFGYHSVTLFFMISGFVILWSSEVYSAREFVVERFTRLFPSFWVSDNICCRSALPCPSPISWRMLLANLSMIF